MRRLAFCAAAFAVALLFFSGCVSTPAGVTVTSRTPKDAPESNAAWQVKRAWVFVEGVQQIVTPATITVRRSFEITNVSLHVGPNFDQVRRYEIERTITGSRRMLDFSFRGTLDGAYPTFTAQELSKDSKGNYIIPYYERAIQIIDHEYDLEIIVRQ